MDPLNLVKTNTTKFLLPLIFKDEITYSNILKKDFIDSYISDFYRPEHDGYLLVVKTIDEQPSGTILQPITKYKNDEDYIFVYDIPDNFKNDFAFILTGSFDKLSDLYKLKVLKFWECDNEEFLKEMISLGIVLYTETKYRKLFQFELLKELYRIQEDNPS